MDEATNDTRRSAAATRRGYFEIGIWHPKNQDNIGTLWRSAYQLGASGIFVIGKRWPDRQPSDTYKTWRHVPYRRYQTFDDFRDHLPVDCAVVGVETGGRELSTFCHPERCVYLLGAEDHGLCDEVLEACDHVVSVPSVRRDSYNVSVAGSIVMYDRVTKAEGRDER